MENNKKITVDTKAIKAFFSKDNLPMLCLIGLAIFAVAAIIASTVAFHVSVVIACIMVVLEACLSACLNRIPIWVHGLVFIAQVVCGIMASQVPFMVLMAFIYVFAITFLYIWSNK
ncbi:hypothetical protein SAMN02910298_00629 [Pseudobutyrivibrio sp. YE44]|uniref:hypothetical protein n=1 Tax=Pseudobutyrivibrio sp. YE44 TaxID=1520802 RepID=UPI000884946F|nr:hypothetical protein [Pseudobutyrivibrio sp. YE44]SDB12310.1 hypothetical protein SAMN02910298_00629 [Pseudobutyrivibrio sp. YE44]